MELVFRTLADGLPTDHELWLRPADPRQRDRRDLACLAAEAGPGAFVRGAGETTTLVVQRDPTLDDMLAAAIVERQMTGAPLPEDLGPLCRYAALCREGLRPGTVPVEESLEGMHAALRSQAGSDLTSPEAGAHFAREWRALGDAAFAGVAKGLDPFKASLLGNDARFARPRAFLQEDRKVYRQDVERGRRWIVRIPEGPERASGLLLESPKSVLWKHWARADEQAPLGGSYLFTAVSWGNGDWVFSTDPVHRQSIKGLAELLQAAENRVAGPNATNDPWFDGKPFGHTLVAAPRAGSKLPPRTVVRLVRKWAHARRAPPPPGPSPNWPTWALAGVAMSCVAALIAVVLRPQPVPEQKPADQPRHTVDDGTFVSTDDDPSRLFVLCIGISQYADPGLSLRYADDDARELVAAFQRHARGRFVGEPRVRLVTDAASQQDPQPDAPPTRDGILDSLLWLESRNAPANRPTRNDLVIVTISGHGKVDRDGDYYLLTCEHSSGDDPRRHGVAWTEIAKTLNHLPCTTIVFLDTCHAGAAGHGGTSRASRDPDAFQSLMDSAAQAFRDNEKGVLLLPACLNDEMAKEYDQWQHGALSLALLEALEGRVRRSSWDDLDAVASSFLPKEDLVQYVHIEHYVQHRVYELTFRLCGRQGVQFIQPRSFNPRVIERDIPISVRPTTSPDRL